MSSRPRSACQFDHQLFDYQVSSRPLSKAHEFDHQVFDLEVESLSSRPRSAFEVGHMSLTIKCLTIKCPAAPAPPFQGVGLSVAPLSQMHISVK